MNNTNHHHRDMSNEEWENFCDNDDNGVNNEWENFCDDNEDVFQKDNKKKQERQSHYNKDMNDTIISRSDSDNDVLAKNTAPPCSDLYISTTTIISYLNTKIAIFKVFWELPVIPYSTPQEGIVKKHMKFISKSKEELNELLKKKELYDYTEDTILKKSNNCDDGTKNSNYKDTRKISIGICKKDITSYRCKKKSAFMNCFVVIMRIKLNDDAENYKEIHVKVFNTGKLEIPGIKSSKSLIQILTLLVSFLKPYVSDDLDFIEEKNETVLINSNFNCGYFMNRDKMYEKLKYKYNINSVYDPCSYPGIQSEVYYNKELKMQDYIKDNKNNKDNKDDKKLAYHKISFMIFRTGSVLIVGKCCEQILYDLYKFICNILKNEYLEVKSGNLVVQGKKKEINIKPRKITINI